jgi:hypothetical protein
VIANCFFDHVTHSDWGGAVKLGTNTDQLNLSSTTFLNCRSTDARGGALYLGCLFTEMNGCCIRNTSSEEWGTAIEGQRDDAVHVFRDSSFVDCGSPELDGDGTIYIDRRTHLDYSLLNFSSCSLKNGPRGTGAVVRFDGSTELPWSLRYCTILECCGKTGIHSQSAMDGLVDHCNFYNNVADSDRGFVYGSQNGFVVSSCVFNNGTGLDLFLLGNGRTKFMVLKCVFSVTSLTSDYFEDSSTDNVFGCATASIALDHFHTYYCPTSPPCLSLTLFVSASQAVFSSAQLKTSESFVSVKPWKPSGFDISSTDTVFDPPGSQADDGVGLSGASVGGPGLVLGVSMGIFGGLAILGLFLLLIVRRKRSDNPFGNPFPGEHEGDGEIVGEEAEEVFDDDYENPLSGEGGIASVADAVHFAQEE